MLWQKHKRYREGGYWHCAERRLELNRLYYERMNGVAYNRLLLRHRRNKALTRMKRRAA